MATDGRRDAGLKQERTADSRQHPDTTLSAREGRERVDGALEHLRSEWRDGCRAGMAYQIALGSVRRLRSLPNAIW